MEIEAIAARTDESPRRVRARLEKEGLADALASQILERKAIDRILEYVTYEEVPLVEETGGRDARPDRRRPPRPTAELAGRSVRGRPRPTQP